MLTRRGYFLAVAAVVVYAVLAVAGRGTAHGEIFPFFSWDLFSETPGERISTAVYLHQIGDRVLDPPELMFDTGDFHGVRITASQLANSLHQALAEDPERAERLRARMETNHLPQQVEWSLVVERFDPVARWRDGTVTVVEVARFATTHEPRERYRLDPGGYVQVGVDQFELHDGDGVGAVERFEQTDGWVRVSGWAGLPGEGELPRKIVVFSGEQAVHLAGAGRARYDIASRSGESSMLLSGFRFAVDVDLLEGRPEDAVVVAVFADRAYRLPAGNGE